MKNNSLLIIQHVPFEGPGVVEDWADRNDIKCAIHKIYENDHLPQPGQIGGLVIMGGPMSVNDREQYPWIVMEIDFIRKCLQSNIPIIGICLGAQFLARTLGSEVYKAREKEIGWFPVQFHSKNFPAAIKPANDIQQVFHWHGETFDLPSECVNLASSESTPNQLFMLKNKALGIQFHLEMKDENIHALVKHCQDELYEEGPYIMKEHDMTTAEINYSQLHAMMFGWLDYIFLSER